MSQLPASVWQCLGIDPTTDGTAIRRAYAAKLRGIDQDNDPEAFMALRNALTFALHAAAAPAAPAAPPPISPQPLGETAAMQPDATTAETIAQPAVTTPEPPPPLMTPQQQAEKAKIEALSRTYLEAGKAGRTEDAFVAYQSLAAAGAVTLAGGIHPAAVQLALLAAQDKSLPLTRVDTILRALGLDAVTLDRLKHHKEIAQLIALVTQRGGAENWLQAIERVAAIKLLSVDGIRKRRRIITARYLLGTWPTKFLVRSKAIELEMKTYDQFAIWLAPRIKKPERFDPARRQKELSSLQRIQEVTAIGWIVLYLAAAGIAGATLGSNGISAVAAAGIALNLGRRFSIQRK